MSQSIHRTCVSLKNPKRPGGSFMFVGPAGVDKTELAKALAEFLFGDENALIRLDMSEFSGKYIASRSSDSPSGYVGYGEDGQLTRKVRHKPLSVMLFNEIEKAHPDILSSLLQASGEGHLTDSQGRLVDFKNTIIIITMDLGTRGINKRALTGFQVSGELTTDYRRMKGEVQEELKQHLRPEFLNRVDEVVVFPQLQKEETLKVVDLMIKELDDRMLEQGVIIRLTPEARALLAYKGSDRALGACPLRQIVQRKTEGVLSKKILFNELREGQTAFADAGPKFIKHASKDKVNGIDWEFDDIATFTFTGRDGLPEGRVPKRHQPEDVTAAIIREAELAAQQTEDSQAVTVGSLAGLQSQSENAEDIFEDNSSGDGIPRSIGKPSQASDLGERRRSTVWRTQLQTIE